MTTTGVVVTTHGYSGVYARQCIDCFIRSVPGVFIVLFVNESDDPKILSISSDYPDIEYVYVDDQHKEGGLTGTWNRGIDACRRKGCDVVILSNDDVLLDDSVVHIIDAARHSGEPSKSYYGPLTNQPGPSEANMKNQYALSAQEEAPRICRDEKGLVNLNGFFMVFHIDALMSNTITTEEKVSYFDSRLPFGGNETEWFTRFTELGGTPFVVPRTFVYHYKQQLWRSDMVLNDACVFTINTGRYDGDHVFLKGDSDLDNIYVTDQYSMKQGSVTRSCIQVGVIPLWVQSHGDPKQTQRNIKTYPTDYLPLNYTKSIYMDGNAVPTRSISSAVLENILEDYNLVCFDHPQRTKVADELTSILRHGVTTQDAVDRIQSIQRLAGFRDDVGLTETCILVRNHVPLAEFSKEWRELVNICIRDQASFDFLLWKHNVHYAKRPIELRPMIHQYDHISNPARKHDREIKEQKRLAQKRLAQKKLEVARLEQDKLKREKLEREKLEREKLEREKLEREKHERARAVTVREALLAERARQQQVQREEEARQTLARLTQVRARENMLRRKQAERRRWGAMNIINNQPQIARIRPRVRTATANPNRSSSN